MKNDIPESSATDKQVCACGATSRSAMERVSRGLLVKTFLFWLPIRKYKCYICKRSRWIVAR